MKSLDLENIRGMSKSKNYKYKNKVYSKEKYFGDKNSINALLYDLEENKEIEKTILTIYNIKGSDNYYNDDEIDGLLELLADYEIIEEFKIEDIADLGEELCQHCPATEHGESKINTNPYNLCEGRYCDIAYTYYLEEKRRLD